MEAQTHTDASAKGRRRGRRRPPETLMELYLRIVQETHRFQTKEGHIAALVSAVLQDVPMNQPSRGFIEQMAEFWARLHYHDVNPHAPPKTPEQKQAGQEELEQSAEVAKRRFSLALADKFLNAQLPSTGMLVRAASGPQLHAEGGKYIKLAKRIPKGKVLDDIASTDEQRLAIAAVLEG